MAQIGYSAGKRIHRRQTPPTTHTVVGTATTGFPTTSAAFQSTTPMGGAKLGTTGSRWDFFFYATYISGSTASSGSAVARDAPRQYVSGRTKCRTRLSRSQSGSDLHRYSTYFVFGVRFRAQFVGDVSLLELSGHGQPHRELLGLTPGYRRFRQSIRPGSDQRHARSDESHRLQSRGQLRHRD